MPLVILLPYLPSLEWFTALIGHDEIFFEHEMHYERLMGLNRTTILTANGKLKLPVPVENHPNHTPIKDIRISNKMNWQKKHWQTIQSAYGHAAYFLFYADILETIFRQKFIFLKDWNEAMFECCQQFLKLQISFSVTEAFQKQYDENYMDRRWVQKNETPDYKLTPYRQVFTENKFIPGLSIIDLIFNEGPDSQKYLFLK